MGVGGHTVKKKKGGACLQGAISSVLQSCVEQLLHWGEQCPSAAWMRGQDSGFGGCPDTKIDQSRAPYYKFLVFKAKYGAGNMDRSKTLSPSSSQRG